MFEIISQKAPFNIWQINISTVRVNVLQERYITPEVLMGFHSLTASLLSTLSLNPLMKTTALSSLFLEHFSVLRKPWACILCVFEIIHLAVL